MDNKVLLKSYASDMEVNVMQMKLTDAGIPSWAIDKRDSMVLTWALSDAGIELYVNANDQSAALALIHEEEE